MSYFFVRLHPHSPKEKEKSGSVYIYIYICLEEKIQIMLYPDNVKLSNQICDLMGRCSHRKKIKVKSKI